MKKARANILKSGGIGVMPTDTIYGLLGSALDKKTVERIYQVRGRHPNKPLIILIGSLEDLKLFGIKPKDKTLEILKKYWPGQLSVVLHCAGKKFEYLHRGTKTLAFRWPKNKWLQNLLKKTGPLVAPSANPEGRPPAINIIEAKKYFGKEIDFYQAGRIKNNLASTLIIIEKEKIKILRAGAVKINKND